MLKRSIMFLVTAVFVLSAIVVPLRATALAQLQVAVCYDPGELLGSTAQIENLANIIDENDTSPDYSATLVTYADVALGALAAYDVAYFWGGGSIIFEALLGSGMGPALETFVSGGGGLVAHCGAAAAMSQNLKLLLFLKIPAFGLIPMDASVEINQLLNLLGRSIVSLGSQFLAPVTVKFGNTGLLDSVYRNYVWDGGVAFDRWPRGDIDVHARVKKYEVDNRRFARYNYYRPFFLSAGHGAGKVMWCPGSPELMPDENVIREILRAEFDYVAPVL